jgi:hypothetical protein
MLLRCFLNDSETVRYKILGRDVNIAVGSSKSRKSAYRVGMASVLYSCFAMFCVIYVECVDKVV